jgi:hypothetical protein
MLCKYPQCQKQLYLTSFLSMYVCMHVCMYVCMYKNYCSLILHYITH